MTVDGTSGLFLVLEGADGSGKSAAVTELVSLAESTGIRVHRIEREAPSGHEAYANLIRSVGRLFKEGDELGVRWDLLSLAAASQYLALLHSEVEEFVLGGGVVVAESWWNKAQVRLAIEASICERHDPSQEEAFRIWQRQLMPASGRLDPAQQLTVLVETSMDDRICWYENGGRIEPVYDARGVVSHNPAHFGAFTQRIADELRLRAQKEGWPVIHNGSHYSPSNIAEHLLDLIKVRLGF